MRKAQSENFQNKESISWDKLWKAARKCKKFKLGVVKLWFRFINWCRPGLIWYSFLAYKGFMRPLQLEWSLLFLAAAYIAPLNILKWLYPTLQMTILLLHILWWKGIIQRVSNIKRKIFFSRLREWVEGVVVSVMVAGHGLEFNQLKAVIISSRIRMIFSQLLLQQNLTNLLKMMYHISNAMYYSTFCSEDKSKDFFQQFIFSLHPASAYKSNWFF